MCGIAGVLGQGDEPAEAHTRLMLGAMQHRGPDQDGLWKCPSGALVFGHKRLSIIDLSEGGRQPMADQESGVVITYNGECYNYLELRAELERLGVRFVTQCDTEVILRAYVEWGVEALNKLRGMFAFAIWDPRRRETLLVRDRLGIKPLYYAQTPSGFAFASEVRALLATGQLRRRLDPLALHSYLWHGFVPGPRTLVSGVRLLEPGTCLRVSAQGKVLEERKYWSLPSCQAPDEEGGARATRAELEKAVDVHLVSDVPLGIFLSGGVDSSVLATMAQRASSRPVTTFNIRFEEAGYDESPYAREVAERLGTDHREVTLTERYFTDHLEEALAGIDQPTFDALNTYFVSRAVREAGLTVALAGTGGDELFGGYSSFVDIPRSRPFSTLLGWLPERARSGIAHAASRVLQGRPSEVRPQTRWGKLADVMAAQGDLLALYQVSYSLFSEEFQRDLALAPVAGMSWGLENEREEAMRRAIRDQGVLGAVSTMEMISFLGDRLLRDTDAASMAVSLEVRVPLLDHLFVERLAAVPADRRFEPLGRKRLLRDMALPELEPALFERKKAGFELPLASWCRNRLLPELADTFQDLNLAHAVGLDGETVCRLWRAFSSDGNGIYWSRVWSIYVLLTWCERHGLTLDGGVYDH